MGKNTVFNILLFLTNIIIIACLAFIFFGKVDILKEGRLSQEAFLTISLTILQVLLGVLAIGIALVAAFGYQTIRDAAVQGAGDAAKKRAEEVASAQINAYLQGQQQEPNENQKLREVLDKILNQLETASQPPPQRPRTGTEWEDDR